MRNVTTVTLALLLLLSRSAATLAGEDEDRAVIGQLLDDFHAAAAAGEKERYLGFFAPDAVFLGTDDWERWPLPAFRDYVTQRFAKGRGWVYRARDRHLMFSATGDTAWFDEIAESPRWGRFRGTGVLTRSDGHWRIAHYSLTVLVPNERFEIIADAAAEGFSARSDKDELVE